MCTTYNLIRNTKNRGDFHVFLGNPHSDGCDKTTVEPGNNFSPGIWTCGISFWQEYEGNLYGPDLINNGDLKWGFISEDACPPALEAQYKAGSKLFVKTRLTTLGTDGSEGVDFFEASIQSLESVEANIIIAVKDIGPAGGKINSIDWFENNNMLLVNKSIKLSIEQTPDECIIYQANEIYDSPSAFLRFSLKLKKEDVPVVISFKTEHSFGQDIFAGEIPLKKPFSGLTVKQGFEHSIKQWQDALPARVFAPDCRINSAWQRNAFHIMSAMECSLPRVGAVNYPLFWLRDGIIINRSLDIIGRHDLARIGSDYLSHLYFGGGFGAESDAPGEGIWALVSHARITKDIAWLASIFPTIEKRVEWILKMKYAETPIRMVSENRMPRYMNKPGVNILCLPAINGRIHGRMDWHSPDFFINCWSEGGLRMASVAAELIGRNDLAAKWTMEAENLEQAIINDLLPMFGNERDAIITPYPSGALASSTETVALLTQKFKNWYYHNRLDANHKRKPEGLWTYFEAAQIHNAMQLGMKNEAWICLDGMLDCLRYLDVSAFIEGSPGGNEYLNFLTGEERRGWLDPNNSAGGNMPHNWTSAEMINLIRSIFIVEDKNSLILCKGVPDNWLAPGNRLGVTNMPTDFGVVSFTVTVRDDGSLKLEYTGPDNYILALDDIRKH